MGRMGSGKVDKSDTLPLFRETFFYSPRNGIYPFVLSFMISFRLLKTFTQIIEQKFLNIVSRLMKMSRKITSTTKSVNVARLWDAWVQPSAGTRTNTAQTWFVLTTAVRQTNYSDVSRPEHRNCPTVVLLEAVAAVDVLGKLADETKWTRQNLRPMTKSISGKAPNLRRFHLLSRRPSKIIC